MIPEPEELVATGQEVAPAVPEIPHRTAPLGGRALLDPITTAVKRMEPPSDVLPEEFKNTRGFTAATVVEG